MSSSPSGGVQEALLPGWVSDLRALVPLATTIATAASNPQEWLANFVRTVVAEWIVGGIINAVQYVLGWAFFAIEQTTSIIVDGLAPLTTPFEVVGDAVVGGINLIYSGAEGAANSAGLAGPPAAAFAFAVVLTVLAVVTFAILRVIPGSDAVEGGLEALR